MNKYILICKQCGAKNRVAKKSSGALCGRCKADLIAAYIKDNEATSSKKKRPAIPVRLIFLIIIITFVVVSAKLPEIKKNRTLNNETSLLVLSNNLKNDFNKKALIERKTLQYSLSKKGYYSGGIDGLWGANTLKSILSYYKDNNVKKLKSTSPLFDALFKSATKNISEHQIFKLNHTPIGIFSGGVKNYTNKKRIAPLKIRIPGSVTKYFIKLKGLNGEDAFSFFVTSSGFETKVPIGSYELFYAYGEDWYGEKYLFGPNTVTNKAEKILVFKKEINHVSGHVITLVKVASWNLQTTSIPRGLF